LQVSSMAPKLLDKPQQADVAAGTQELPLVPHVQKLTSQVEQLQQQLKTLRQNVEYTKNLYETSTTQAFMFAQWPIEAVAVRRGIPLTKATTTMDKETQVKLRELMDRQMAHVDRVERMPSPYLWQVLEEMEQRIHNLKGQMESLNRALENSKQIPPESANVVTIIRMQEQAIWKVATSMAAVHSQVDQLRNDYRLYEKGTNVLELADQEERQFQQALDHKMREQMVKSLPAAGAPRPGAPAPGGSLYGSAPAPSGGLFGAPSPAPGGFGFGNSPAPTPGGLFGSTPAPAPPGGIFGSTPAPAPGGSLFGSNPAPAPAFGAPAPAPATGGFAFGNTPPAAPAPGGFGSTPPAPASAFGGFASAPSASVSTPKTKNKSRSTRRR
jgi:outer membrane murein-binding lipoprotein Lpp